MTTSKNGSADADVTVKMVAISRIYTAGLQARVRLDPETVDAYVEALERGVRFPPLVVFYPRPEEGRPPDEFEWYFLADGFHRLEAYKRVGRKLVEVEVHQVDGDARRSALLYAVGANDTHGLRRTNADKRHAVKMLLEDPEWENWADRKIGRQVGVTHPFVASIRAELSANWKPLPDAKAPPAEDADDTAAGGTGEAREDRPEEPAGEPAQEPPAEDGEAREDPAQHAPATRKVERGGKTYEMQTGNIGGKRKGKQNGKKEKEPPAALLERVRGWTEQLEGWTAELKELLPELESRNTSWRVLDPLEKAARGFLDRLSTPPTPQTGERTGAASQAGAAGPGKRPRSPKRPKGPAVSEAGPDEVQFEIRWTPPPDREAWRAPWDVGPLNAEEKLLEIQELAGYPWITAPSDAQDLMDLLRDFLGEGAALVPDSEVFRLLRGKVKVKAAEGGKVVRFRLRARGDVPPAEEGASP
jgi:hypothetical protein